MSQVGKKGPEPLSPYTFGDQAGGRIAQVLWLASSRTMINSVFGPLTLNQNVDLGHVTHWFLVYG